MASHANSSSNLPGRDERDVAERKKEEKVAVLPVVCHAEAAAHCGRPIEGGRRFR
jgi:hypothetical protein